MYLYFIMFHCLSKCKDELDTKRPSEGPHVHVGKLDERTTTRTSYRIACSRTWGTVKAFSSAAIDCLRCNIHNCIFHKPCFLYVFYFKSILMSIMGHRHERASYSYANSWVVDFLL